MMTGTCLRFYIHENHKHNKKLAYEKLLDMAAAHGALVGSAFRSMAGFRCTEDEHHEDLVDSVMDMTIVVEVILSDEQADRLIDDIRQCGIPVLLTRVPVQLEVISH